MSVYLNLKSETITLHSLVPCFWNSAPLFVDVHEKRITLDEHNEETVDKEVQRSLNQGTAW